MDKEKELNRKIYIYIAIFILILSVHICLSILPTYAGKDEFVSLFNGKNLDGWINVNCAPETWSVRDGMIICTGIPTGVLRTERIYQNYILEMDWMHLHRGGNAGLFLHSDAITALGQPFTRSIEVQVMEGNHGDVFSIHGATLVPITPHPQGWDRALPTEKRAHPAGEWNHYRVESRDGMITLSVNGEVVTRAVNCSPRRGYICLESEGSEAHFRNIRIHELPGEMPPPENCSELDRGFHALYNGLDLRGWKQVKGNEGHWQAKDWILDYDGKSEAEDKSLWTEKEYGDFILIADWRQPARPVEEKIPNILPDGSETQEPDGSPLLVTVKDAGDSGIYLRGDSKCQVNIWNWPIGSGEIWGYRTDDSQPPDVRRAATPILRADHPIGEWNRFIITMRGDRITVELNGKTVIREARLPGVPARGPIALQHHGDPIQFANLYIKELE